MLSIVLSLKVLQRTQKEKPFSIEYLLVVCTTAVGSELKEGQYIFCLVKFIEMVKKNLTVTTKKYAPPDRENRVRNN
jgi:hypothetical protein